MAPTFGFWNSFFILSALFQYKQYQNIRRKTKQKKQLLTMVQTRRSFNTSHQSPIDTSQSNVAKASTELPQAHIHSIYTRKEVLFHLLTEIFRRSKQHIWYRILPKDDGYPDITNCTGVEWEHLLPLLVFLGLISFRTGSMVKQVSIVTSQWKEMAHAVRKHVILEVSSYRRQNRSIEQYICIGNPMYSGPRQQFGLASVKSAVALSERKMGITTRAQRSALLSLQNKAVDEAVCLLAQRQFARITKTSIDVIEQDNVNMDEWKRVASEVEKSICFAEALDLHRRPRLSRLNAGKFFIMLRLIGNGKL